MQNRYYAGVLVIGIVVLSFSAFIFGCTDDDSSTTPGPTPTPTYSPTPTPTSQPNTPPDTVITDGPDAMTALPVWFAFTGEDNEDPVDLLSYSHRLDFEAWSPWQSDGTATFETLSDGAHIFEVKACDSEGLEDDTPAQHRFDVDTEEPDTWFTDKPPSYGYDSDVYFEYAAADTDSHPEDLQYSYYFDNWGWSEFSMENWVYLYDLDEGLYEFSVRSRDAVGNIDSSPDYWEFFIDCGG